MKTIALSITSKCEENCTYCFRKEQKDTTLLEFKKKLANEINENGNLQKIVITGGNPELNPDFWGICKEVKKRGLKLKVHSNYSNMKTWEKYLEIADEVAIPIDSLGKQKFRSEKSAKNFILALNYFFGKKKVQVHSVASKRSDAELKKIQKFLEQKNFFEKNSWKIFKLAGVNGIKNGEPTKEEWEKTKKNFSGKNVFFVEDVLKY